MDPGTRSRLASWLRALRDLDVEFLALGDRTASGDPPVTRPAVRVSMPGPAAGEGAGRPEPPPSAPEPPDATGDLFTRDVPVAPARRGPLAGAFPATLQLLSDPELEPLQDPPEGEEGLRLVRRVLGECTRCRLHEGRTNLVFGVGNPEAEILFVGEGPGRDEDIQGEPFVGRAGRLLDQMIKSMGCRRPDVYIANVVKCRPPENRTPAQDEAETCSPFLHAQIAAIRPRVIVALGLPAAQALLGRIPAMSRVRGMFQEYRGLPVMPTYHPAYLLRSPGQKPKVAHDLALVLRLLGRSLPAWAAKALREEGP